MADITGVENLNSCRSSARNLYSEPESKTLTMNNSKTINQVEEILQSPTSQIGQADEGKEQQHATPDMFYQKNGKT